MRFIMTFVVLLTLAPVGLAAESPPRAVLIVRVEGVGQSDEALHPVTHPRLRRLTFEGVHLPAVTITQSVGSSTDLWRLTDPLATRLKEEARVATVRSENSSAPEQQRARSSTAHAEALRELAESFDDPGTLGAPELEFLSAIQEILQTGAPLPSNPSSSQSSGRLPTEIQIRRELEKGAQIVIVEDSDETTDGDERAPSTELLLANLEHMGAASQQKLHVMLLTAAGGRKSASLTIQGPGVRRGWVIRGSAHMDAIAELVLAVISLRPREDLDSKILQEVFQYEE
jgi:hypothetical protein